MWLLHLCAFLSTLVVTLATCGLHVIMPNFQICSCFFCLPASRRVPPNLDHFWSHFIYHNCRSFYIPEVSSIVMAQLSCICGVCLHWERGVEMEERAAVLLRHLDCKCRKTVYWNFLQRLQTISHSTPAMTLNWVKSLFLRRMRHLTIGVTDSSLLS